MSNLSLSIFLYKVAILRISLNVINVTTVTVVYSNLHNLEEQIMALTKIYPARDRMRMREAMLRRMAENHDHAGGSRRARLPIDAYATDNEIVVTTSIPGINPEEVEITLEGESLTIRGEIAPRLENVRNIFAERFHGPFSRTLQLNVPVDIDNIEATFDKGVLTLVLPKAEEARPKVIKVQTK